MGSCNGLSNIHYYSFDYTSADREIEWAHRRREHIYPQTREKFIEIIEEAKRDRAHFYVKCEEHGYYGNKTNWWVYRGNIEIDINEYQNAPNCFLCFPSEAQKELHLAEQRKFNNIFPDGYDNYIRTIQHCRIHNKPFAIYAKWGDPNYYIVHEL